MNPHEVQTHSCVVAVLTPPEVIVPVVSETPATPRPAATILLLRRDGDGDRGLEVLMVRRAPEQSFMPGVWVFPGGAIESGESPAQCAIRELAEEASIELAPGAELRPWMRWITPEVVPVRFDTHFLVGRGPSGCAPEPDAVEVDRAAWFAPRAALDAGEAGEIELVFPTIKTLETLLPYATADEVLAAAPKRDLEPILPRVVGTRERHRVLLPWDEGYG